MRKLAAVGVERQLAVAGNVLAAVQEILGLADPAESQRLDPRQAVEREPVVEFGDVNVGRGEGRAGPHVCSLAQYLWLVGQRALVPIEALDDLRAYRLHQNGRLGHIA